MKEIDKNIQAVRDYLSKSGLDAVIIPSNDPHQSEYVADYWKLREHFSGFSGSAGTLVITKSEAALWTDSRYFLQVEKECAGSEIKLHKQSIPHAPEHVSWLNELLDHKSVVGIDFRLFSPQQMEHFKSNFDAKNISLCDTKNGLGELWEDQPEGPAEPIVDHPVAYAGVDRKQKIEAIKSFFIGKGANHAFYSKLDEIAWIFNIRSRDVDFTPLATAYALISENKSYLFIDVDRVESSLKSALQEDGVELCSYDGYEIKLTELTKDGTVLIDASSINYSSFHAIQGNKVVADSIVVEMKSVKNEVEIENFNKAMVRDGVALSNFFFWLNRHLESNTISEYDLGRKLESFRMEQECYVGESFSAIVGYKGNGAIVHYTAPESGSSMIQNEGILLLDSGAQYLDATTDITRTIWLGGEMDAEIKKCFTLVLKGYISLETAVIPEGTSGIQVDALARMHLWQHGYRYGHGTGHGVGSYGPVHESPQGFANNSTTSRGTVGHQPGQVTSIEPGCYVEGKFGIRTENLVLSVEKGETAFGQFIGFEPITLCYIDTSLIDLDLVTPIEMEWLNSYHKTVYEKLSPHLSEEVSDWLKKKCAPIV